MTTKTPTMIPWDECTRAQQVERYVQCERVLESLTPHQREKHFDMRDWANRTECGTVACAAGHCGFDPWFQSQGLSVTKIFKRKKFVDFNWKHFDPHGFFGADGYSRIFTFGGLMAASVDDVLKTVRAYRLKLQTNLKGDQP